MPGDHIRTINGAETSEMRVDELFQHLLGPPGSVVELELVRSTPPLLSDTQSLWALNARLGTAAHFCEVVVLKIRTVWAGVDGWDHTSKVSLRRELDPTRVAKASAESPKP